MKLGVKHCQICDKILHKKNESRLCSYHYRLQWSWLNKMETNYKRGARKEHKIVQQEKIKGCLAFRSAGSHSPIDVVSIDIKHKQITFIQSKPDSMSDKAKLRLESDNKSLNGVFNVSFIVK